MPGLRPTALVAALVLVAGCSGVGASATSTVPVDETSSTAVTTSTAVTDTQPTEPSLPDQPTTAATTSTSVPAPTTTTTTTTTMPPPTQWIWAWRQNPGQIVAIGTDGTVNVLVDTPDPATLNNARVWRVGQDKAFAMYATGSKPTAYLLTASDATSVDFPTVHMAVPTNAWSMVATSGPYAVIRYSYGVSEAAVLIDFDTATATLLSSGVADLGRAAIFSADGHHLRYVTTAGSGTPSKVVERDLTTGGVRTLYSYTNFDHIRSDATGDVWLDYRTGDLVAADGRATNGTHSTNTSIGRWLVGEWLMTYHYDCDMDCPLTMTPVFGTQPDATYVIPKKTAGSGVAGWLFDDDSLLVLDSGSRSYWRLTPDAGGLRVGHGDPYQGITALLGHGYTVVATDAGAPGTFDALLDVQTGDVIPLPVPAEREGEIWLNDQPGGLILMQFNADDTQSAWSMSHDTHTFYLLPIDVDVYCDLLLADGTAICHSEGSGGRGVFRYDPITDTSTPLSDQPAYLMAGDR